MNNNKAFSLVEILAAAAVLSVLGLFVVQILGAVTGTTGLSDRSISAALVARQVFDQMGSDIRNAVIRDDVDFMVEASVPRGTSFLTFLSKNPSARPTGAPNDFSNRKISLLSYRISAPEGAPRLPCLLRAGRALGWNDRGFMGFDTVSGRAFPAFDSPTFPIQIDDADYDVLGDGVVAMICGFQLYPDNGPVELSDGQMLTNSRGQVVYQFPVRTVSGAPGVLYPDASRIASLVVGLVVVAPDRLTLLNDATYSDLAAAFDGLPQAGVLPVEYWMGRTAEMSNLPAGVPLPVRQSVRVYQRFLPVNTFPRESN